MEHLLEKAAVALNKTIEFGNTEGVKKAVEADLGIAIISRHAVLRELAHGLVKSIPLAGMDLRRDLYIVRHKDRYLSAAARAFLRLLQ